MKQVFQILNILAFLAMVVTNYFAEAGKIAGETMNSVSVKYQTMFTPADYAFSIWGLIYFSLLGFVIFQARDLFKPNDRKNIALQINWWFCVSCLANIFWIISWLNEHLLLSVVIMSILLFSLIKIILNTRMELDDEPLSVIGFVWWPFSFYSGWITVALIANVAALLSTSGWDLLGLTEEFWTIIMIVVTGGINLWITWTRNMREFALVGAWALVAIAVANWNTSLYIVISSITVAATLLISSSIHGYKNRKTSPWKKL